MSVSAAAMPSRISASGTDRQAPPVPVRRIHSLPDRTVSEQSQLDDILSDLLNDPLFVDGSRTYEISNEADGTYATIASNHGSITTSHPGGRRQMAVGSPAGIGGGGGGGGGRTVVSWQTNQTGPRRTVAVNRRTVDRPTPDSVVEVMSSRRIETESSARPSSAGRRVGESSGGSGGASTYETRRLETRSETTTKREGLSGGFDSGAVRVPPSPPTRRRVASQSERVPPETNATYRSYWESDDSRNQTWFDDKRGGRYQTGSAGGRRAQTWRQPTDVALSDTEDYFRSSDRRGWDSARYYNDPYLSDDMSIPYHSQQQRRSATSARSPRSGVNTYETKRNFFVSGIERPANTNRQTKYTFSVSPQRSVVDEDELVAGRHGGLFKPPPAPQPPARSSLSPGAGGSLLPPLRGPSSREAVLRVNATRDISSSRRSRSPSLDDLERSLQSVQLLLETQPKNEPVNEPTLVGKTEAVRYAAPVTNYKVEEIEEEVISLQPIGPGVQNLEPDDPTRLRSMTPAFPTQQRGFRTSSWSDVRPHADISPVSAGPPISYQQVSASTSRIAGPQSGHTVVTSTPARPAAPHDIDVLNALLNFDAASSPPPPAPASGPGRVVTQNSTLSSPDEVFAFPYSPQRSVVDNQPNSSVKSRQDVGNDGSADAIYHTPRQLTGYGGSGSGTSNAATQHQQQPQQLINVWSGGTGPTVAAGYQTQQSVPSSSDDGRQKQQQQQGGGVADLGLFGAMMDDTPIQPHVIGKQESGPSVSGGTRGGSTGTGNTVQKEMTSAMTQFDGDIWKQRQQPIVVQDFSSNHIGQASTLPPASNRYPAAVEESTLTKSHQAQQHAGNSGGNGLFTLTSRTVSPATLANPQPDKGRSVSPSDMALRARLQSRLESRSPGITGRTSPSLYTGHSRTNSLTSLQDGGEVIQNTPRFVRDSSKYWHKPHISREEAISLLRDKPPGYFVVRNSNTFQGAFGLALKVAQLPPNIHMKEGVDPQSELVRHFLIEPTSKGVRLKGCSNEPAFGSLAALVYQHTITPLALPCKLILPEVDIADTDMVDSNTNTLVKTQLYQQGAACNVVYISSIDMESLTGPEALSRAIAVTFPPGSQQNPPATTVVHFKVSSQGITLTDSKHKLFFRRFYPINTITFCGVDVKDRRWTLKLEEDKILECKIFGFVARKPNTTADNACHIFGEIDPNQPANAIVNFLTKIMIGQGHLVKT